VFSFFLFKNITLSLKKSFIIYSNIKFFSFRVDILGLFITKERLEVFYNLEFLNILKVLEKYIGASSFIRYFLPYYSKFLKPF
ncbi:hypothetical protein QBC45DRAFT_330490, partial [Copromyces sp. CBS 386.78]